MPSLNQLISNVQNPPDKGAANRARSFTKRQIASWIHETRGFLVSKSIEKGDSFPVAYQQDLGCWELETVDQADCMCPFVWGDNVKKLVIPEILELDNNAGIMLFLIDKRTRIYLPSQVYGILDDHVRFKGKGPNNYQAQMIGNQTIYIKYPVSGNTPKLKVVNPRGVFKDPTLVTFYNQQGEAFCYDYDKTPYPIPGDMEGVMLDLIWKRYLLPFVAAPRDNTNQEANKSVV